ncbi:UDP-N-acetylglucosamine acyltransferase [Klebsiella oxytoca]|uniref:UDP-N-acetylglucosamine acyltransferase n=1 Tax=Klebsiella oxytoca TaxID=571 RepID=UPI001E398B2E|nr:UDP-N-acetylglucosamine acyltransferase [Klebsiella oxytoca]MDG9994136.1 UDP-N-acetylglucosamine acyltransferase [Klebsiella oxytoca]MDU4361538.1 UDP-N-acetylglucosamine acyltransferase [Klebsiella oxytoca]
MKKLLLIAVVIGSLTGCASVPPLNFSTPGVGVSQKKIDAQLKSLTVSLARPDEQKGDIVAGMETITPIWRDSLQEALDRMAIFKDNSANTVSLNVKVLAIDVPSFGMAMTTKAVARYEVINRSNGDIIYTQDIESTGTVPVSYAFVGVVRARESINRAVQNNITQFLQALESIELSRPMFPSKVDK